MKVYSERIQLFKESLILDLNQSGENVLRYRGAMHRYQLITLVVTALITILLGIKQILIGKELALIFGAFLSIISGIQVSERFNDRIVNWSIYNNDLKRIHQELEYYIADGTIDSIPLKDEVIENLHNRYLDAKARFNEKWVAHFADKKIEST